MEQRLQAMAVVLPVSLQVTDVVVNTTDARPVRVSWRVRHAAHEVPLGQLHRLLAADPPLGLAIIRGLRDWELGRVCSEVGVGARRYRAGEWTRLGQMGCTGRRMRGDGQGWWGVIGRARKR